MKYVYVLTAIDSVYYYAVQCSLSVWSLRYHNPHAYIVLVIDRATKSYLENNYSSLISAVDEIKVIDSSDDFSPKSRSRFIKTSLRQNIDGNFLYIDSDTVIADSLENLNYFEAEIAATFDCNASGKVSHYMSEKLQSIGIKSHENYISYNGGVLLVKDTENAHRFFNDWHQIWLNLYHKFGMEIDQVSFLIANHKNGDLIKELPGIYNCQLPFKDSYHFLINAKIIHYIADYHIDDSFPFKNKEFLNNIFLNGISEKIENILTDPKTSFLTHNLI